jgi:large subunit ribosomal protein L21
MSERKRTFAVINDRGRRHTVRAGDRVLIDRLDGDPGSEIVFDQVVLLAKAGGATSVGKPNVDGAKVVGVIEGEHKGQKLKIYKWRRRENYRRRIGHRQRYTQVRIRQISA